MAIWTPLNALGFTISPTMVNADEANMTAEDFANLAAGNATVQPQGVEFNYLGAGSPMLDYKGNEEGYNFTDNYDPAFGELESYISGDTGYPQQNETVRTEEFDRFEEIPSLQRRLGNPRFSLGQPQNLGFEEESETISTPVYQDRIMNRNLPGFAYESPKGLASIINSQLRNAKTNVGQKVGQGFDFAKQLPGMAMSALSGIPFAGQMLSGLGNMFEDRQLTGDVMDEYGNMYSAEDLNKMNALGGWYTDPARSSRRRTNRIQNMLARKAAKKNYSEKNLKELLEQQYQQSIKAPTYSTTTQGGGGGIASSGMTGAQAAGMGGGSRQATSAGSTKSGRTDGGWGWAYGGRVGYANGGLASLFTRRG